MADPHSENAASQQRPIQKTAAVRAVPQLVSRRSRGGPERVCKLPLDADGFAAVTAVLVLDLRVTHRALPCAHFVGNSALNRSSVISATSFTAGPRVSFLFSSEALAITCSTAAANVAFTMCRSLSTCPPICGSVPERD